MLAVVAMLSLSCGGRSVERFCDTFADQTAELEAKYAQRFDTLSDQDPLIGLLGTTGSIVEAVGDAVVLYTELEAVAPDDIAPDVAAVRDALSSQLDAMRQAGSDPFGAMFSGVVTGTAVMGSEQRVNQYVATHCR